MVLSPKSKGASWSAIRILVDGVSDLGHLPRRSSSRKGNWISVAVSSRVLHLRTGQMDILIILLVLSLLFLHQSLQLRQFQHKYVSVSIRATFVFTDPTHPYSPLGLPLPLHRSIPLSKPK